MEVTDQATSRSYRPRRGPGLVLWAGLWCISTAVTASAEPLRNQLEQALDSVAAPFTGYETVPRHPAGQAPEKFLVLDFRFAEPPPARQIQTRVHQICQAVLLDRQLVETLSADGYNRLAVAFDRDFQYDCF